MQEGSRIIEYENTSLKASTNFKVGGRLLMNIIRNGVRGED